MNKRLICTLIAVLMLLALFAGCGQASTPAASEVPAAAELEPAAEPAVEPATPPAEAAPAGPPAAGPPAEEPPAEGGDADSIYPLSDGELIELTIWMENSPRPNTPVDLTEMESFLFWDELEEKTGVHLAITSSSYDLAQEQFNIMVSSGDYCDLTDSVHNFYPTGVAGAIKDEYIIDISKYVEEYMPNYCEYLYNDPDLLATSILDEYGAIGEVISVYTFRVATWGLVIRQDWLNKLDLQAPKTIDEMHDVLTAFKTEYDCSSALMLTTSIGFDDGQIASAYGVPGYSTTNSVSDHYMYQKNGTVHSTFVEDGYRDYLALLHGWYDEGLISTDFTSMPSLCFDPIYTNTVITDNAGIFYVNAAYASEMPAMQDNPEFDLAPIAGPSLDGSNPNHFSNLRMYSTRGAVSVTVACKDIETALRYVDWFYTEDGYFMINYGVEDVSYHKNGTMEPDWDEDNIINSPYLNEFSYRAIILPYKAGFLPCGLINENFDNMFDPPIVTACKSVWSDADYSGLLPDIAFTERETGRVASVATEVQTYASENIAKFITGERSLDEWDDFVKTIKEMGMDDVLAIYQDAMDRYYAKVAG